ILFIRPAELFPDIQDWPIYEVAILACLVVSFPAILERFPGRDRSLRPTYLCLFGLLLAIYLSHLAYFRLGDAWESGFQFAKVVVYFVLLVSLVNTYGRLRVLLLWLVFCIGVLAILAVLQFNGLIHIQALEAFRQRVWDDNAQEYIVIPRMC